MKNLFQKFKELFFKEKVRGDVRIIRILFFRFEVPIINTPNTGIIKPNIEHVGKCTYSNTDLFIACQETKISSFCSIGMRVVIGHGNHPLNFLSTSPYLYFDELNYKYPNQVTHSEFWKCEPVEIGNDVWIGDGVFIKNGIKIGDGAILGKRAVITKDIPPYAIVAGCPAKVIKYRFNEEIINELLKLKWWELDDDIIKKIPYDNIDSAIKFLKEVRGEK